MLRVCILSVVLSLMGLGCAAQTDSTGFNPKWDYQIYLKQPAKEIMELLNDNTCDPIDGRLSEDGKTIIMKNYQKRSRVDVRVIYQDGTIDEFIKSSCFIDPVI